MEGGDPSLMATIDDKVVAMSFESSKFESGVNRAIASLELLKKALNFPSAGKGLDDINAAAKRVDMGHIAQGVEKIKGALESLRLVAIGVMSQLATQAVRAGAAFVKAFTLDPIKAGFAEYSTNLNAIQTILANTQTAGVGLKQVNATLKELNEYSDKTIYNFGQMAKNIGTFTAAGVELDTATASIKGIANLAALSGSNADQASTAMYQLSQAIAAGSVKLMDWNSVVNAGMGGTVFQRALAQTAEAMGTLEKGTVKLEGPMKNVTIAGKAFRQSLSPAPGETGWLTSGVLTSTLKQFTSDLSNAELAAMGFNKAQIASIQQTAKTAMHAATEVKTIAQVFDVAKETAGSGWAATFQIIFGTFTEAKKTFTALSETINGFINTNADARNKVLQDWKDLGGRTVLINSIKTAFHNLGEAVKPIKEAFRDIFPATTGKDLYDLTLKFRDFANALKPGEETIANLKRTFAGLFAIFSIAKQVIGGVITTILKLLGAVGEGRGGFLEFTGGIGDFLVSVDQALKKGDRLGKFFEGLGKVLSAPIKIFTAVAAAIRDVFAALKPGGASGELTGVSSALTGISKVLGPLADLWDRFLASFEGTEGIMTPVVESIVEGIGSVGKAIGEAASQMTFEPILAVIQTGLLGGLVLMFKKFFGKGAFIEQLMGGLSGMGGGILGNIAGSFRALEGSMVAMQQNIKAKTLKEIAIAVGILAASMVALSFINAERLGSSLTAMTIAFGELLTGMAVLTAVTKTAGFIKLPLITSSMILLAGAITVLSTAVLILAQLSWGDLIKGLGGVAALLGTLVVAIGPLSAGSAGLIRAGIGITGIAIGLRIMASAVAAMASLSLGELAKGLTAVAIALGTLVAATSKIPSGGMIGIGIGLMAVATAMRIMANAVAAFGALSVQTIAKGLGGIAGALVIVGLAMRLMPKNMIVTGAGLLIVAGAMHVIASAIEKMGGMSINTIAKGLITLAAALVILGIAMAAMSGMIAGAAALAITAAGISLLAGALVKMGGMSWGSILKSLITLAAALTIIGIAGALITPVIPSLLGLGAALLLIGAGLALAGAGVFLIATGLSALVVALPTGVGVLIAAIKELQTAIPEMVKNVVLGLLEIVNMLAEVAPKFVDAIIKIISSLLDAIIQAAPKFAEAFGVLLAAGIQILHDKSPSIIQAGFDLLMALIQGIRNNIGQLVTGVVQLVTAFLQTIAGNLGKIVTAGLSMLVSLVKGVVGAYAQIITTVVEIIARFVGAIASNLGKIVTAGLSILTSLLRAIANNIGNVVKAGADIIIALVKGIGDTASELVRAARQSAAKFMNTLADEIPKFANDVFQALIKLINGMAATINANAPALRSAGINLGVAIIDGMTGGLISKAQGLYNTISGIMDKAMSIMKKIPGVDSPAKETIKIGQYIMDGLYKGISGNGKASITAAEEMSRLVIGKFAETFQTYSPSKVMYDIGQYVAQGFADGLRGGKQEINEAFEDLNGMLTEAMRKARETIIEEEAKLNELRKAKKPDMEAIKAAEKAIAENESILKRSKAAHDALVKSLQDEKAELIKLAGEYDKVSNSLKAAQDKLKTLQEAKAAAIAGFSDQYATLPGLKQDEEITGAEQLATYMQALKDQADAVAAYRVTLDELRKLGLDDATYQKLLEEGTADQEFATALLAGGKTAVQGLNTLDKELKTESDKLAKNAGKNLHDAGIQAAKGLISGLKSQKAALIAEMEAMADEIVAAFNRRLKARSPSRVFMEIGGYIMDGLAIGISSSVSNVKSAVEDAADAAIGAMQSSLSKLSEIVTSEINTDPVITPILDLTTIRTQAAELGALTNVTPITAAASYGQAALISSQQQAAQEEQLAAAAGGTSVKFEQNNYSPESLTEIEIYRQTKNQLSQLKSALSLT
jgi:tape measure domain-containing protein